MDIETIERVNVLSQKVINCEVTLQELSEYRALLRRWADNLEHSHRDDYANFEKLLDGYGA